MDYQYDRTAWFQGSQGCCVHQPPVKDQPPHLVLLGPPGVGKGTQAALLSGELNCCHLSTGDVFRAARCLSQDQQSPALQQALEFMRRGDLVPDEIVLQVVRERSRCINCGCGFILDGFPRTVAQAEALDQVLETLGVRLDAVINYEIPLEQVIARISGRRTCSQCKAVFHTISRPPRHERICDECSGELIQREDDREEAVRFRLDAYTRATAPLIDYYFRAGLLVTVPSSGTPREIFQETVSLLEDRLEIPCEQLLASFA